MIDASIHEPEKNIRQCKRTIKMAKVKEISTEAGMGRIEGCKDGLPIDALDAVLPPPDGVRESVERTGVYLLAPSFGNIHGSNGHEELRRLPV